ncbi:hypothetical protein H5T88_01165 [bacterium]|nr:hypothetical protein [bacterium]
MSIFLFGSPHLIGELRKGETSIALIKEWDKITGFSLKAKGKPIASIYWDSLGVLYPTHFEEKDDSLLFRDFKTHPSFSLSDSYLKISFSSKDDYPEIYFRLKIKDFDLQKWESAFGKIPFHFLACSLPGASIFQGGGGWSIATPNIDPYPLLGITPEARKIASEWSENWTYAPSIEAHAQPVAGLWYPEKKLYIGYAFYESRLKGEPPPPVGMAYCWKSKKVNEFLTLVLPYAKPHRKFRYPQKGDLLEGHFTLLYSTNLPSDSDPNLFCNEFAWRRYYNLMPSVPNYSDLSWLPSPYRVDEFRHPPFYGLIQEHQGDVFIKKGSLLGIGTSWLWPLDYFYEKEDNEALEILHRDLERLKGYARHIDIDGDHCVYWQWPLEGDWQDFWGKGVPTLHNIHGTLCALAFLDAYRNERNPDYLPYIDGALLWLKHILFTRNCYPDVPDGMFAWDAAPFATFCIKYADTFRKDRNRKELVSLAERLTRSLVYRCLAMFSSDNNPFDNIDSSWMMGGNAGEFWIGIGSANELWEMTAGVLLAYISTGDPILGQYLRGILERWHWLFRDSPFHKRVLDWDGEFAEIWALCDGVPGYKKDQRSKFGGLWGGLEQLIYPPKGAKARVVCRQKSALAFNIEGIHTTISQYKADAEANFSFKINSKLKGKFPLAITWPFSDLRKKRVKVNGEIINPLVFVDRPDTVIIPQVEDGDLVEVGNLNSSTPLLSLRIGKGRRRWEAISPSEDFQQIDLSKFANVKIRRDWLDNSTWAGYEGGLKWLFGIPFVLIEPGLDDHPCAFRGEIPVKIKGKWDYIFLLIGGINPDSLLLLNFSNKKSNSLDLSKAVSAIDGWPPIFRWKLSLIYAPLNDNLESIKVENCLLFAVTLAKKTKNLVLSFKAIEEMREEERMKREKEKRSARVAEYLKKIGKCAILPLPQGHDNSPPEIFYSAVKEGLLHLLTPEEFVDKSVFNAKNFPILFVFGDESYIQTVREFGDGDRALIEYLKGGGTIVSLANGPTPFAYNEKGILLPSYDRFGFTLCGRGGTRPPKNPSAYAPWEKPPLGERFVFRKNISLEILKNLPEEFPFYNSGDLRWRPMGNFWSPEEAEYIPLITLYDSKGENRGDGAVIVRFKGGVLAPGRVVYVWFRLWQDERFGDYLIEDIIKALAETK